MNHDEIRHKLSEYIDGSLNPEEKAAVDGHLKTCPRCAEALRELEKTVEHIRNIEEAEPPAWMTQKIMARVRAEEEKKKQGLFRRFFFPLHIKLPLEALGVLFIAVTAYFVAQDVQKTQSFPEATVQTYSQEPAQTGKGTAKEDRAAQSSGPLQRSKKVPQAPGYGALDMKPAYEKPKPPMPATAPEPMRRAEEQRALKDERFLERKEADQTALGFMQNKAPEKEFSSKGAESQAPAAATAMARNKAADIASEEESAGIARGIAPAERQLLTLAVSDVDKAAARVEDAVKKYGGKVIRKEPAGGAISLTVSVDAAGGNRFIEKLKTLGELKGADSGKIYRDGSVIEIRIVKQN